MPAHALSTEFLATLPGRAPTSGAVSYFDTEIKGFLLEHRASGGATFYFRYRDAAGKVRMNNIGRVDEIARGQLGLASVYLETGIDLKNGLLLVTTSIESFQQLGMQYEIQKSQALRENILKAQPGILTSD